MFLLWLLIIGNLLGGFIAASSYIVNKMPKVENFSKQLNAIKLPIGLSILGISIINIFNFWVPVYPKLTLLFGLILGLILSVDILKNFSIDEDMRTKIIDFANKFSIPVGLISFIIGLIWILDLVLEVVKSIL